MSNFSKHLNSRSAEQRDYAIKTMPRHLIEAQMWKQLEIVLTDLSFLEAKAEYGLVFDLADDFSIAVATLGPTGTSFQQLDLLHRAIRHDLHFIARHPECLFQCLWNVCWWHDAPESSNHYELPESTGGALPGNEAQPNLYGLLEEWKRDKEERAPGFVWVRSLRPPAVPLKASSERIIASHSDPVRSIAVSPVSGRPVSAGRDGTIRLWDQSGIQLAQFTIPEAGFRQVAFSPDGAWLASCGGLFERTVRVWDGTFGVKQPVYESILPEIHHVSFSSDGSQVFLANLLGELYVWHFATGQAPRRIEAPWTGRNGFNITGCLDAELAVVISETGELIVWDMNAEHDTCRINTDNLFGAVAAISKDRTRVALGCDHVICVWDRNKSASPHVFRGHTESIECLKFSPADLNMIASTSLDGTIRIWNIERNSCVATLYGHRGTVHTLAWSRDGSELISGGYDSTLRIWPQPHDHHTVRRFDHASTVKSLAFVAASPSKAPLRSGTDPWEYAIHPWVYSKLGELARIYRGRSEWVGQDEDSDDNCLVSGSDDGQSIFWDINTGVSRRMIKRYPDLSGGRPNDQSNGIRFEVDGPDSLIRETTTGRIIAYLPVSPMQYRMVKANLDGRTWAISTHDAVDIFHLEGDISDIAKLGTTFGFPVRASKSLQDRITEVAAVEATENEGISAEQRWLLMRPRTSENIPFFTSIGGRPIVNVIVPASMPLDLGELRIHLHKGWPIVFGVKAFTEADFPILRFSIFLPDAPEQPFALEAYTNIHDGNIQDFCAGILNGKSIALYLCHELENRAKLLHLNLAGDTLREHLRSELAKVLRELTPNLTSSDFDQSCTVLEKMYPSTAAGIPREAMASLHVLSTS